MMEKIINPVPVELIKAELTTEKKLLDTNRGGNEIYVVSFHDSPNVVREIGRLREMAFRQEGAGTGKSCDLDKYDIMDNPFRQIIIWDPVDQTIIGGYRFIYGRDVVLNSCAQPMTASGELFDFSKEYISGILPHTMELGRAFVSVGYQSSKSNPKAIFALDNLWDGLLALMMMNDDIDYYFGKVTIYPRMNPVARDLLYHFLWKHYGDDRGLIIPKSGLSVSVGTDNKFLDGVLCGNTLKEDYLILKTAMKTYGETIPAMVNSYINACPKIKMPAIAINHESNDAQEAAILVPFNEMDKDKIGRHIENFRRNCPNSVTTP